MTKMVAGMDDYFIGIMYKYNSKKLITAFQYDVTVFKSGTLGTNYPALVNLLLLFVCDCGE